MIFNPEFRELVRAAHRPSQHRKTPRRALDQDNDRNNVTVGDGGPLEDPNEVVDPDDSTATEPLRCALLLPPPAQSEAWWAALVLGRESDAVSPPDVFLASAHVAYRLGITTSEIQTPPELPLTITVGELHATVEKIYGSAGWTALVQCWRTAAGIVQPERKSYQPQCSLRTLDAKPDGSKPDNPLQAPIPPSSSACRLEEGLHRALPSMPPPVAAFLLHSPKPEPPWRYRETGAERELREQYESDGAWCG